MRTVHILLARTGTVFSRMIHVCTAAPYTHASICLDDTLGEFYSFGRKKANRPFPAGLVKERLDAGYFGAHRATPCMLLELEVDELVYQRLCHRLDAMLREMESYHYSLLGVLFCVLDIRYRRSRHYFCSQFVGEMLKDSGALQLPKPPTLMRPMDYTRIPQLKQIFTGNLQGLAKLRTARLQEKAATHTHTA